MGFQSIKSYNQSINQSINQYYFITAWQNAGPQFAQIKLHLFLGVKLFYFSKNTTVFQNCDEL